MLLVDLIAGAMVTAGAATVIGIIGIVLTRGEEREDGTEVARATRTSSVSRKAAATFPRGEGWGNDLIRQRER